MKWIIAGRRVESLADIPSPLEMAAGRADLEVVQQIIEINAGDVE